VTTPTPTRRTPSTRPRGSDVGTAGRGLRFALAGGIVALVYFSVTVGLHEALGVPFQIALLIGFVTALIVHFTLQRAFVWVHADGYALATRHQASRYLAVAAAQYGITAAATAVLPDLLGVSVTYVYLATAVLTTIGTFLVFRARVFHPAASSLR
jgi:putative flippase GtrA